MNNLGPINRVGAGGLDAAGNEFLLFKKTSPPFAFKKDAVASAVHTFEFVQKPFSPAEVSR